MAPARSALASTRTAGFTLNVWSTSSSRHDSQRNAVEIPKRMIWRLYRSMKDYKLAPSLSQAEVLLARFDRVFAKHDLVT